MPGLQDLLRAENDLHEPYDRDEFNRVPYQESTPQPIPEDRTIAPEVLRLLPWLFEHAVQLSPEDA